LNLSKNRINHKGTDKFGEYVFGPHSKLKHLDISRNDIGDIGCKNIVQGLTLNKNTSLEFLGLKETNISDDSGQELTHLIKSDKSLLKVDLEGNIINHKFIADIQHFCQLNRELKKKVVVPEYQKELGVLLDNAEVADWNDGLIKIDNYRNQIQSI
jgi:hypothetical protein